MPRPETPSRSTPPTHHPVSSEILRTSVEDADVSPDPPGAHLLPLHHVKQVSEGRVLGVVEGQQGQRALHLSQALPALLALLGQLGLRELQRRLRLPLADQLDQVLLLVGGQADG